MKISRNVNVTFNVKDKLGPYDMYGKCKHVRYGKFTIWSNHHGHGPHGGQSKSQ